MKDKIEELERESIEAELEAREAIKESKLLYC